MDSHNATHETAGFGKYVEHGWKLIPIREGQKRPTHRAWNRIENAITDPEKAEKLDGAGVALAYSGLCTVDVDRYDDASIWLAERGIDLDAHFRADNAVQITSGRANRGKLLYRLDEPLPTTKFADAAFELRSGTRNGLTSQDLVPNSLHPNRRRYEWLYNSKDASWRNPPALPRELHDLWRDHVRIPDRSTVPATDQHVGPDAGITELLEDFDPDVDYDEWVKIGMALHHDLGDAGFTYWDTWSSKGTKYKGSEDLQAHWDSFGQGGDGGRPVTLGSLRQEQVAADDEFEDLDAIDDEYVDLWESAKQESRERFQPLHVDDFAKRPPPEWDIPGVLQEKTIPLLYGPSGSGKSFVALDLSMAIARGVEWRPGLQAKQGAVVYICAEGEGDFQVRCAAYGRRHDVDLATVPLYIIPESPNFLQDQDPDAVAEGIVETAGDNVRLVVIDTLSAVSPGGNENASETMTAVLHRCKKLSRVTGATVMLVHHSGKDASRGARGHSSLEGNPDSRFRVTADGDRRNLVCEKQKAWRAGDEYPFRLETVPVFVSFNEDTPDIDSCVVEHLDSVEQAADAAVWKPSGRWQIAICDLLDDNPLGLSEEDLIESVTAVGDEPRWRVKDYVKRTCKKLCDDGRIRDHQGVWILPSATADLSIDDLLYGEQIH